MKLNRESILPIIIAALLGMSGGSSTVLFTQGHTHPELARELLRLQWATQHDILMLELDAMESNGVPAADLNYQLRVFTLEQVIIRLSELEGTNEFSKNRPSRVRRLSGVTG